MSYQVNFRLFVPDCEFWESEAVAKLQRELHDACVDVIYKAIGSNKQIGLTSAEVVYLNK